LLGGKRLEFPFSRRRNLPWGTHEGISSPDWIGFWRGDAIRPTGRNPPPNPVQPRPWGPDPHTKPLEESKFGWTPAR